MNRKFEVTKTKVTLNRLLKLVGQKPDKYGYVQYLTEKGVLIPIKATGRKSGLYDFYNNYYVVDYVVEQISDDFVQKFDALNKDATSVGLNLDFYAKSHRGSSDLFAINNFHQDFLKDYGKLAAFICFI